MSGRPCDGHYEILLKCNTKCCNSVLCGGGRALEVEPEKLHYLMVKSPSPWGVKGVDSEAREAVKIAARKAGLTVGAWLNQMIR